MSTSCALACTICIPVPTATAADRLIAAETVVLARENPEKPFSYSAIEVLKGEFSTKDIDLFLNSSTRRRLASNPDQSVVLVLERPQLANTNLWSRRVEAPTEWRSIGYATAAFENLVRQIIIREQQWTSSGSGKWTDTSSTSPRQSETRTRFFMPYLSDPDRASRLLAYQEVGRAPYHVIRTADEVVETSDVREFLADITYLEWHPLYILLFGVNATEAEKTEIRDTMNSRLQFESTRNLAAWATALIEIDGEAAIDWLDTHYLGQSAHSAATITEILTALSVQGSNGRTELRSRIAESYALALEIYPNPAAKSAMDLVVWKDLRFTDLARQVLSSSPRLDPAAEYALNIYAGMQDG